MTRELLMKAAVALAPTPRATAYNDVGLAPTAR